MFYVFGKKITSPKAQPKSAIGFVNVTCAARLYRYQETSLLMLFCFISNIFDPRACCFSYEDMGNPISEAYNLTAISFSWAYISRTISVTRNSILDDSPGVQWLCTLLRRSMRQKKWSLSASSKPHSKKTPPQPHHFSIIHPPILYPLPAFYQSKMMVSTGVEPATFLLLVVLTNYQTTPKEMFKNGQYGLKHC